MNARLNTLIAGSLSCALLTPIISQASPSLSGGVWFNYRNITDSDFSSAAFNSDLDSETNGDIADEALILYADHKEEGQPWYLSAEMRFGPGGFTNPATNSTGDNFALHKAWIAYQFTNGGELKIGKSQVPFGWKTVNFWPGDVLLGGYGDQMDVGFKYSRSQNQLHYDLAYYHADDWGETSTDTVDDNNHWGSPDSYRKSQTIVFNIDYSLTDKQTIGLSAQSGWLQDLTEYATDPAQAKLSDKHSAINLHYHGQFGDFYSKAQYIQVERELPNVTNKIENWRAAIELGYTVDKWFYYLDASFADTDTEGNSADSVQAHALGASYSYGPGWIYLEYLTSDGDIGADGDIYEADFDALYVSIDYYF